MSPWAVIDSEILKCTSVLESNADLVTSHMSVSGAICDHPEIFQGLKAALRTADYSQLFPYISLGNPFSSSGDIKYILLLIKVNLSTILG